MLWDRCSLWKKRALTLNSATDFCYLIVCNRHVYRICFQSLVGKYLLCWQWKKSGHPYLKRRRARRKEYYFYFSINSHSPYYLKVVPFCIISLKFKKKNEPLQIPSPNAKMKTGMEKFFLSYLGLPGGTSSKEPTCHCKKHKRGGFDLWVEKEEMATHSSILAWRMPWTEKPGRLRVHRVAESDTTEAT